MQLYLTAQYLVGFTHETDLSENKAKKFFNSICLSKDDAYSEKTDLC